MVEFTAILFVFLMLFLVYKGGVAWIELQTMEMQWRLRITESLDDIQKQLLKLRQEQAKWKHSEQTK